MSNRIHFAVIPDGNRRFGKEKEGSKLKGYDEGLKALKRLFKWFFKEKRVKTLSLYVFSEDNWERPDEEVEYAMKLFKENIVDRIEGLLENGDVKSLFKNLEIVEEEDLNDVFKEEEKEEKEKNNNNHERKKEIENSKNIKDFQNIEEEQEEEEEIIFKFCSTNLLHPKLPSCIRESIEKINSKFLLDQKIFEEKQSGFENKKMINICFSYDGRKEIIQAIEKKKKEEEDDEEEKYMILSKNNENDEKKIDNNFDSSFTKHLLIRSPVDIILRTSGEKRLSGFLTWQNVHSELFFVDKKWPEMKSDDFDRTIEEYLKREKRFGR